jgi:endonuclease YncB( thermonuclease family)
MDYLIEVYDNYGRRVAWFDEVPLLDATRGAPDDRDRVRGLLPRGTLKLGHGYVVRVIVGGAVFCEAAVTDTAPQWSDTRKLILDHYVGFHEVIEFDAERPARDGNGTVTRAYQNRLISAIVKDAINSAVGDVHYTVAHTGYPDGAEREYAKFLARKTAENELEVGGITEGQWVDSARIDATSAYAKDGDTIAGLTIDGAAWPDVRLMLIDAEETSLNSHATSRHPDIADWTSGDYDKSGYKLKGDAAKVALQAFIDTNGIDYIELNPHRDSAGDFDDRVDAYGRYLGLVYGGGECFNAGLVEHDLADVYLWSDGTFLVPELELKDFYSYAGPHSDSVAATAASLVSFDVSGGVYEVLTALAYAAGGYVWEVDHERAVSFRQADQSDRVVFFDPVEVGVTLGSQSAGLGNFIVISGNPQTSGLDKAYARSASIDAYGFRLRFLDYFSITLEEDADKLGAGLLDDLAYPEPTGAVVFFGGAAELQVGELIELRGGDLRRLDEAVADEWGGDFTGQLIGRIREVTHRFTGREVVTTATLTSPFRSVANPLSFITRSQPEASTLFQFRLDEASVGLDLGYHLD